MHKHLIVASRAACFVDASLDNSTMHWHWLRIRIVNHGVCLQTTKPDQTEPGRVVDWGSRGPRCSLFIDHGHLGPYP